MIIVVKRCVVKIECETMKEMTQTMNRTRTVTPWGGSKLSIHGLKVKSGNMSTQGANVIHHSQLVKMMSWMLEKLRARLRRGLREKM